MEPRQRPACVTVVLAVSLLLGACGSGDDAAPEPATPAGELIAAAAADPANDTALRPAAAFTVLQDAGVAPVQFGSAPRVRFTVISDGAVKRGLGLSSVSAIIAKLVPASGGEPARWVSYTSSTETATPGVGPGGVPAVASAPQATMDPKQTDAALRTTQLVYDDAGYYTYTFRTDITDPAQTGGVSFEPARTHRVSLQLAYVNAAGETVRVNPSFDFTVDAQGRSVAVTDASLTRRMSDTGSCNACHERLSAHGGGRVDTTFCVTCHNPGTTDANSGHTLDMPTMTHKIHAGRRLKALLDANAGGEDYVLWGYRDEPQRYAEVGYPQDLRNCSKCHSAANPATPQGDLWKTVVSKSACLTCHASGTGSAWRASHTVFNGGADPATLTNAQCQACHLTGSNLDTARVHYNQNEENAARYRLHIESATYDPGTRDVTLRYYLADPTSGDAAYELVTADCTGSGSTLACPSSARFGNLRLYLAYQNLPGQPIGITDFSAYNNGGNGAQAYAYRGDNDGRNRYTVRIAVPPDTGTAVAAGSARVVSTGQVKEPKLQAKWATDPRPEVVPRELVNVVVQHTHADLALTGPLVPRRAIVSNEKCNACHAALGTTSGSNTLAEAFHSGARNTVESCPVCHDANRASSTVMTDGQALQESYQFQRMIHGIHGNSRRSHPFTHGNRVVDAFAKDGSSLTGGAPLAADVQNYAAEVAWSGIGIDCNACHVNGSYRVDWGQLGAVVAKPTGVTDPLQWLVISPKAASCTACHDSTQALAHVAAYGGSSFGTQTQAWSLRHTEICADCHGSGGVMGVDRVHSPR